MTDIADTLKKYPVLRLYITGSLYNTLSSLPPTNEPFLLPQNYLELNSALLTLYAIQKIQKLNHMRIKPTEVEGYLVHLDAVLTLRRLLVEYIHSRLLSHNNSKKVPISSGNDVNNVNKVTTNIIPLEPRAIRLCRKLGLEDKEKDIFLGILAAYTSMSTRSTSRQFGFSPCNIGDMADMAGMHTKELFDFIDKERLHMKQGFITINDNYRPKILLCSAFVISNEVLKVLVHSKLTSEEYLKIDKTEIADILMEEGNFIEPGMEHIIRRKRNSVEKEDTDDEENSVLNRKKQLRKLTESSIDMIKGGMVRHDEMKDGMNAVVNGAEGVNLDDTGISRGDFDLYSFLRAEKLKTGPVNAYLRSSKGADDDESSKPSIRAYVRDIEYLEDRFQVLLTKIKVCENYRTIIQYTNIHITYRSINRKRQRHERNIKLKTFTGVIEGVQHLKSC